MPKYLIYLVLLFISVGPEIVGPEEETFEVNEGQSILLPCEVSGNPRPMVQWRQNFRPFNPRSARFQFQETGLYLQGAQVADKAIYECIVSNIAGNTSKVITLIVYSKCLELFVSFYHIMMSDL